MCGGRWWEMMKTSAHFWAHVGSLTVTWEGGGEKCMCQLWFGELNRTWAEIKRLFPFEIKYDSTWSELWTVQLLLLQSSFKDDTSLRRSWHLPRHRRPPIINLKDEILLWSHTMEYILPLGLNVREGGGFYLLIFSHIVTRKHASALCGRLSSAGPGKGINGLFLIWLQ